MEQPPAAANSENNLGESGDDEPIKLDAVSAKAALEQQPYWHGFLPREDSEQLLKRPGDFLVRVKGDTIVLTALWHSTPKHFLINKHNGQYKMDGASGFPSVPEMIVYYWSHQKPISKKVPVVLKRPVPRRKWELQFSCITLKEKIGSGNFGDVWKGTLLDPVLHKKVECAIKTCRQSLPEDAKRLFLREAKIMRQYDHPNIVGTFGVCVEKDPIMLVMELVNGGSLDVYLRGAKDEGREVEVSERINFCYDAAKGMAYLEEQKCIHRDLAARNCLLGKNNVIKISDFGMSREGGKYTMEGPRQIPVKWTAPECMNHGVYTTKSDVWSYAVLMWEIFSDADEPYKGLSNQDTRLKVETGERLPTPDRMPEEIATLMTKCWSYDPLERPTFASVVKTLNSILKKYKGKKK